MQPPAPIFHPASLVRIALRGLHRCRPQSLNARILLAISIVTATGALLVAAANLAWIKHERALDRLYTTRASPALAPPESQQLAQALDAFRSRAHAWRQAATLLSFALLLCGAIVSGWLARRVLLRPLRAYSSEFECGGDRIAASASSFAEASQHLSATAAQAAGALRVSSATLQDLGTVSQANCDRAQRAKELAARSLQAATAGSLSMQELDASMDTLQRSSRDVEKIVKTIDDIAFQTNILALNAAVEAARAGFAGAGFAVVAEEVRRLARHAAQSARDTAGKISEATLHSQQCVALSRKVVLNLGDLAARAQEVDTLVVEIASTSKDQAAGIRQLARVMSDIDSTTHRNAARGAETADLAVTLGEHARQLHRVARAFTGFVAGPRAVSASPVSGSSPRLSAVATDSDRGRSPGPAFTQQPSPERTPGGPPATACPAIARPAVVEGFEEF